MASPRTSAQLPPRWHVRFAFSSPQAAGSALTCLRREKHRPQLSGLPLENPFWERPAVPAWRNPGCSFTATRESATLDLSFSVSQTCLTPAARRPSSDSGAICPETRFSQGRLRKHAAPSRVQAPLTPSRSVPAAAFPSVHDPVGRRRPTPDPSIAARAETAFRVDVEGAELRSGRLAVCGRDTHLQSGPVKFPKQRQE